MSITLTLLFRYVITLAAHVPSSGAEWVVGLTMRRSVGAIIFGLAGDLYGRKWPMIVNLLSIAVFQLSTAYCEYAIHNLRTKPKLISPGGKASLKSFWRFVRYLALEWEVCHSYLRCTVD